jgi:hypothetical protein
MSERICWGCDYKDISKDLGCNALVEDHHLIPKAWNKDSKQMIPLCRYCHRMTAPFVHSIQSTYYPVQEAHKVCKNINRHLEAERLPFRVKVKIMDWRRGKSSHRYFCIIAEPLE